MKARFFKKFSVGLVLSAMPLVGGGHQETTNATQLLITASGAEPLYTTEANAASLAGATVGPEAALPPVETAPVATPVPNAGEKPPSNIKLSSSVGEVVKLAQSGVDDSVMLTYISNSPGLFNISSDEIIYLNDLGVSDGVVTGMIQHDQGLKQTWTETAQAQNAAAQANAQAAQAAAPGYPNPPQAESQPDQVVDSAQPQPANVTYNNFYDSLSPYGTWVNINGYGPCWQPTVMVLNSGWRPYCDRGRWLYTDAGWYWSSDYSWGWAAFHYGRWLNDPRWGWCWNPGYVWGPSWVSWRYSNDYCGWAPLPPAACYRPGFGFYYHNRSAGMGFDFGISASWFNFVPWGNVCDRRPWQHRVPETRVAQIYNQTTSVNNFGSGDHNRVINHGIPIDRVRQHSRTEIRQVAIREAPSAAGFGSRGERLGRDGRTLLVHRPNPARSAATSVTSPLNVRGAESRTSTSAASVSQGRATVSTPAAQRLPPGSLVVIGRRNPSQERNWTPARTESSSRSTRNWIADRSTTTPAATPTQTRASRASAPESSPGLSYNESTMPTPRYERREVMRQQSMASWRNSTPAPARWSSQPQSMAPTYNAPRSTPAPSYSPAPARAPSTPSPSQGRSDSGRQGSWRRN